MNQLRIAHLFQSPSIRYSEPQAAQLHIYHTIRGLQEAGHEAALVALQGRQLICANDLAVFHNPAQNGHFGSLGVSDNGAFKLFESGVRRVQRTMRFPYLALFDSYRLYDGAAQNLRDYDVLHERFNLCSIGGALAGNRLGKPLILEVNADLIAQRQMKGKPEQGLRLHYGKWATRYSFEAATKIICISEGLKTHLQDSWRVPEKKLTVLPCAADIQAFQKPHDDAATRRAFALKDEPVVMWVGGFFDWHDLPLLLNSFELVLRQEPSAQLVLVGDGDRKAWVEQTIAKKNMVDQVILTGSVAHQRVPALLSMSDIVVSPAVSVSASQGGTGSPLKLFEYMAAGKAIVATDIPNAAAVLHNDETALLVKAGDSLAFSKAIVALLRQPELRNRLANNAKIKAEKEHSWERYTQDLLQIYEESLTS